MWPDDEFGSEGMTVEEEMETVRAILLNPAAGEGAGEDVRGQSAKK